MVAVSDRVWCVLWKTSSVLAVSSGIWLTWEQILAPRFLFSFLFFPFTLEVIPLASRERQIILSVHPGEVQEVHSFYLRQTRANSGASGSVALLWATLLVCEQEETVHISGL